jgi:hypothetical protein
MNRPDFIIIPCVLIADAKINPIDRMVYGFVYWYSKMKNEKCIASNETLAELCGVTPKAVQHALGRLEKQGYIKRSFADSEKMVREEITPLVTFKAGVSADTIGVSTDTSQGYRKRKSGVSTDTQNKNNTIRIDNNIARRAVALYSLFWKDTYGTPHQVSNWGKVGKLLKPLEKLNDWQLASLIWLHFNWHGASGADAFANKRLSESFFPLEWIPNNLNGYVAYLVNTLEVEWENEASVKKFILPELKKIGYEEKN